jgi:hypothetical protein
MRALQQVIVERDSTAAQREAAREELAGLLKSPAGVQRGRTRDETPSRAARAAIDPFPSVVKPAVVAPVAPPPASGVARMDLVDPPKPVTVHPQTGSSPAPSGRFAVDPRTGQVLHESGAGFIDPRTGQITPR